MFFSNSFTDLLLITRLLIYFELIFIYGVKKRSKFTLMHVEI